MDGNKTEFDLAELVKGKLEDIRSKLTELSDDELTELRKLESDGEKRVTLLHAIDDEVATRTRIADAVDDANAAHRAQVEKLVDANDKAIKAKDEEFGRMVEAKNAEIERMKAGNGKDATTPAPKAMKAIKLDPKAEVAALVAQTGPTEVRFADMDGVPFSQLPALEFGPSDFTPNGERAVLSREVNIPAGIASIEIGKAFLFTDDKPVAVAELVMPFAGGGGRQAKLPGGTLSFERSRAN